MSIDTRVVAIAPEYPALFTAADLASLSSERRHIRLIQADLLLLVAASAFGAVGSLLVSTAASAIFFGTACFLLATLVVQSIHGILRLDHDWYTGRAVAESVKSSAWRYMMRVEPLDGDEAERAFVDELRATLASRKGLVLDLSALPDGGKQITERMQQVRALDLPGRRQFYLRHRIDDQISWYARRAVTSRRAASFWFVFGFIARFTGLALAILAIVLQGVAKVVGVFLALAAVATAWRQFGQHDELARSYAFAAEELALLRTLLDSAADEKSFTGYVRDTENAISREYTLWAARRS